MKEPGTPAGGAGNSRPQEGQNLFAGVVLGFVLTWMAPFLAASMFAVQTRDQEVTVGVIALLVIPVVSLGLLAWPRTRARAAGLLIGLAIGSVLGAGTCVPIWVAPA